MASKVALERLVKGSRLFKRGAEVARQEIFGNAPQLNIRTGGRRAKKPFTGPYLEKYYPTSIHTYARKVRFLYDEINFWRRLYGPIYSMKC